MPLSHSRSIRSPYCLWDCNLTFDLTSIGGVFRATTFHLAVIFDAFARRPLAWRVFEQTPAARQMTRLLQTAIDRCGRPPLSAVTLEARLRLTLGWYTTMRPHSALDGATPGERYQGRLREPPARSPPRGRRGEGTQDTPFTIAFVDPDRTLPALVRRAA